MSQKIISIPRSTKGNLNGLHFETGQPYEKTVVVIICHGFGGDQTEWGRFTKTALNFNKAGFDAVTFDFSGSGKNPREPITLSKQVQDLKDVHEWVKSKGYNKINVLGLSFGGLTTLAANLDNIRATIFWAPAFYFTRHVKKFHFIMAFLISKFSNKPRLMPSLNNEPLMIQYDFLKEGRNFDVEGALANYLTPSLLIQGDKDERILYDWNFEAFQYFPQTEDYKFVRIEGAGHDFKDDHLDLFIENSISWLKKYNF
nr:alpha/beta fold hydrolase [Candidatus Prometheoarchaeum syntrophicum]QEE15972.1 2-hydroxy-6-oxononadienedioate/2-hydroxy-6-oxononatrienedioate hydrolase [Candidatus Prometheoarchaeum syntrophicum]